MDGKLTTHQLAALKMVAEKKVARLDALLPDDTHHHDWKSTTSLPSHPFPEPTDEPFVKKGHTEPIIQWWW